MVALSKCGGEKASSRSDIPEGLLGDGKKVFDFAE